MIADCLVCFERTETPKPTRGQWQFTCPACQVATIGIDVSFIGGIQIIEPTDRPPQIRLRYGSDLRPAESAHQPFRSLGLAALSQLEAPQAVGPLAAACPCPKESCGLCCCGQLNCAHRARGVCRCPWVDLGELSPGDHFQDSDEGWLGVVVQAHETSSTVRLTSDIGKPGYLTTRAAHGQLVKPLDNVAALYPLTVVHGVNERERLVPWSNFSPEIQAIIAEVEASGSFAFLRNTTLCIPVKVRTDAKGDVLGLSPSFGSRARVRR